MGGDACVADTDDPELARRKLSAGIAHAVDFRGGQRVRAALQGPPDPLSASGEALTVPLELVRDPERDVALVRLGDEEVVLQPGDWSEWIPVGFASAAVCTRSRSVPSSVGTSAHLSVSASVMR